MKGSRIIIAVAAVFMSGFIVASMFNQHGDYYNKYQQYKYGFIPYYSTIDKKLSEKDKATADEIIALAGKIMTDVSGTVFDNAGELNSYSLKNAGTDRVEVKINLITADFTFTNGYMWVEYMQQSFDESENEIDSRESLAYWKLRKQDGEWQVVKIKSIDI